MLGKIVKPLIYFFDIVLINAMFIFSMLLRFEGDIPKEYQELYKKEFLILTFILVSFFYIFGLYKSLWQYASVREATQIVLACLSGCLVFSGISYIIENSFPKSVYILYPVMLMAAIICSRLGYRAVRRMVKVLNKHKAVQLNREHEKRVMLVGAGEAARLIINDVVTNKDIDRQVILCVDDDRNKQGLRIRGIPIKGTVNEIISLAEEYKIDEIIIAIPSASKKRISEIVKCCNKTNCKLRIFPGIHEVLTEPRKTGELIRDVRVEDLLGRDEIILHNEKIAKNIYEKTILVTGGGGSIGSELCRQIIELKPSRLLVFDIYENNAYDLQMELLQNGIPKEKLVMIIGSVRDKDKLEEVFSEYQPNIVFHAAAHKHVPLMEYNPGDAIKNNIFGTLNVAQCARKFGSQKFVLVSTDKAVNPTNVMGATKRVCEMIVQAMDSVSEKTDYVAVRFGNVLGSNGSVVPLFRRQLKAGGPLTVTHPDIIRYFMTIPEAVRLILEASSIAKGGEIFVLDMGEPVKIYDLAKNFIKLSGLEEGKDIEIKFTGLRPGEKLFEELLMNEEGLKKTESEKIFIGQPLDVDYDELMKQLDCLYKAVMQKEDLREELMKIVPTYKIPEYNHQIV